MAKHYSDGLPELKDAAKDNLYGLVLGKMLS
jgi:hypothetical protein